MVFSMASNAQIFSEDFENGLPAGWTMTGAFNLTNATDIASQYFNPGDHTTFVGVNDDGLGNGVDGAGRLETGIIDLTNSGGSQLVLSLESFFVNGDYQGLDETAKVFVSTNGGDTWVEFWNIEDSGAWQEIGKLFPYAGQQVMLAFEYADGDQWNYGWCLDDIAIKAAPGRDVVFSAWNKEAFFSGGFEGGKVYPGAVVRNNGTEVVTSVDLIWSDGTNSGTQTFPVNLSYGQSTLVQMTEVYTIGATSSSISLSVGNVNGMGDDENTANDAGADLAIEVITPNPDRGVFVEEATGTWCQFCPRGDVFMNGLSDRYPEKFVGVAVHNDDPMAVTAYDAAFAAFIGGYPSGTIERSAETDPSAFEAPFVTAVQQAPPARLNIGADFDEATRVLELSVDAEFMQAIPAGYKLGAIIVEDGVTGTNSGYAQVNAYSGGTPMGGFEYMPNPVPAADMVYNHVGRALIGGFNGMTGSIPGAAAVGERYGFTFAAYTVPANIDLTKTHIVGLLFNASSVPVNAVEVSFEDAVANGIFVGTNDNFDHNAVSVFPNPFTETANLNITLESNADVTVEIFNAVGQSVSRRDYGNLTGNQNLTIDGTNLESGVYFIHVRMGDVLSTKRVTLSK